MKSIHKKMVILFLMCMFIMLLSNKSNAAYFSDDINGIDENRYPNYKNKLIALKCLYPNIELLYTELDWNSVIYFETESAHGRNLVSTTKGDKWHCTTCKNNNIKYDNELYCASSMAVKYYMDPRNFLNPEGIFQFQKLNSSAGTLIGISKIVPSYLNTSDCISAFETGARNNDINAYHLVTRVIQEQGYSGETVLSRGEGYNRISSRIL